MKKIRVNGFIYPAFITLLVLFFSSVSLLNPEKTHADETEKFNSLTNFTITKIEPSLKNKTVQVSLTTSCSVKQLRNSLKIYPSARLQWYNSYAKDNTIFIKGKFKPGQNYTIVIPKSLRCGLRTYRETINTFRMPDLKQSIEFVERGTIIERKSRQMLHASVTNVDELLFQGLRIPPILTFRANEMRGEPFEAIKAQLEKTDRIINRSLGNDPDFRVFLGDIHEEKQLFFPGKERNKKQSFSIPLSFRKDKDKGAIEFIRLKSNLSGEIAQTPIRLFRITDIGLTYKLSGNSLMVWATSLNTGRPLKNISLLAFTKNAVAIPLGKTEKDGVLIVKNLEDKRQISLKDNNIYRKDSLSPGDIVLIVAVSTSDSSFIEIKPDGNIKPDWINQSRLSVQKTRLLKGHIFTERGIYRPGDTVHFKGTVREYKNGAIAPPEGLEPMLEIRNSKGERVYERKMSVSEFGTISDSLKIKSFFPLGTYTINMKFGSGEKAGRTFQVQEFRAPRHFAEVHCRHEKKKDTDYIDLDKDIDLLRCNISGSYYAGGPVKHGKVRWKIYYTSTNFLQKDYPEFIFGNTLEKRQELLESGESILDERGKIEVAIPMSKEVVSGVYGIEVVATVVDFDGRASTEITVYQEEPEYLIGISSHKNTVQAGDSEILKIIIVDRKGKRLKKGRITVDIMKKGYSYVRKRNEFGNVFWGRTQIWRKELSTELMVEDSKAVFDFDFVNGGDYLLKFIYQDNNLKSYTSSTKYTVGGYFYSYEYEDRKRNFEKLIMVPEKKKYAPGETIKVFLNPHKKISSLLMTIERDDILEHRIIKLKQGQKFINIPVKNTFAPNIYVSLLGTVARGEFPVYNGEFDDNAPSFLFNVANIEIKTEIKGLEITVNKGSPYLKAEPGAEMTIDISVTDDSGKGVESEMAVGVVDESVLALTGFETPTLETLSSFISPLSVFTGELRTELLKQTPFGYISNEPLTGGGGIKKRPEAATTKVRKDFNPVAYFTRSIHTDNKGIAQVTFRLPDTMTTYRIYVVACDKGSRFASNQRGLTVVKDFYLEPGVPRFFTRGDRFTFSVSSFNKTDKTGLVHFSIGKDSLVSLSTKSMNYPLKALDRVLLPVKGEALKPGVAKLVFSGEFEDRRDAIELKVPVNSGYLLWHDVLFGTIRRSEKIRYSFPEGTDRIQWDELNPDDVDIRLTVSGSPFLRMSRGLKYLLKYPYGCVEQTSSGVLPLAALRGLIKDGLIPDLNIAETDKFLKPGIERLFSMQTSSGGFGYWPGNIRPHKWGTIYATTALLYAKLAGFELPQAQMDKAMDYLKKEIKKIGNNDKTFKGFAIYILAMNGVLDEGLFIDVYNRIDHLSREGALLVLLAAKAGGFLPEKDLTEQTMAILNQSWDKKRSNIFYARYREPAIALLAGVAVIPEDPLVGRLAKQLLGGINKQGIWTSTSDTGWSLAALGGYFKGAAFSDKPVRVMLRQEGWPETSIVLGPKDFYTLTLEAMSFLKKPELYITTDSNMNLVYMLSLTFPRVDYAAEGYSNGFRIHKTIKNTDGSKTIRVGDVVKIKIDIEVEGYNYNYIVLDDPLPAGLVAINTALRTEEDVGDDQTGRGEDYSWNYWDFDGGFYRFVPNYFEMRDDRVLVFKDRSWKGTYQYSYYARAVCQGEFIMPSTKIQLMYKPDVSAYTPLRKIVIEGR